MLKSANGFVVNIGGGAARSPGADFSIGASVNAAMGNFPRRCRNSARRTASTSTSSIRRDRDRALYQLIEQRSKASGKSLSSSAGGHAKDGLRRLGKATTFRR